MQPLVGAHVDYGNVAQAKFQQFSARFGLVKGSIGKVRVGLIAKLKWLVLVP